MRHSRNTNMTSHIRGFSRRSTPTARARPKPRRRLGRSLSAAYDFTIANGRGTVCVILHTIPLAYGNSYSLSVTHPGTSPEGSAANLYCRSRLDAAPQTKRRVRGASAATLEHKQLLFQEQILGNDRLDSAKSKQHRHRRHQMGKQPKNKFHHHPNLHAELSIRHAQDSSGRLF